MAREVRQPRVSPDKFRRALGQFVTGVTVVTTVANGTRHGMTVNAFASVSLDPLLVLASIDRDASMHDLLPSSQVFAVTVLAYDQEHLSTWFSSSTRPSGSEQFNEVGWRPAPVTGCPILDGGVAWLDCRVTDAYPAGDHSIFLGEVVDLGVKDGMEPLVFHAGEYSGLSRAGDEPERLRSD